jgi:hypothetical protein
MFEGFPSLHQGKEKNGTLFNGGSIASTRRVWQRENIVNVMTVDSHLRGNDIKSYQHVIPAQAGIQFCGGAEPYG